MSHSRADLSPDDPRKVWTIVVAGGSGLRFGARKQFAEIHGKTVLQRSVDAAAAVSEGVIVVVPADSVDSTVLNTVDTGDTVDTHIHVVAGGASRAESVRAGLAALPDVASVVLVHDAARPLASPELFARVVQAVVDGAHGVVPAVDVSDTIRHKKGGVVDRSQLLAVQTPQGFDVATLRKAHATNDDATDDATLVEALGHEVVIVEGEAVNQKLTEPTDLLVAASIIEHLADTNT